MIRRLRPLLLLLLLGPFWPGAPAALAEHGTAQPGQPGSPVVAELFTSQGCSSCPPADALLGELAMRGDVLALSLHVDYWDYMGWQDRFASPEMSERQRAYARTMGTRMVYTPQMVVDGEMEMVGSRRGEVEAAIEECAAEPRPARITVGRNQVSIAAGEAPEGGAVIWLVSYDHHHTTEIGRGENSGRRLAYHNVVRSFERLGHWRGEALTFPLDSADLIGPNRGAAILVQDGGYGQILGAARIQPGEGQ